MRLGIMQPYFYPYCGHFSLIAHTDRWIVFDVTQYTPKAWMNRNVVLHPSEGRNWISVPLRNGSISIKSHEARILDVTAARQSILGKLSHYKKHAPYYRKVVGLVEDAFALPQGEEALVHLNVRALAGVCAYLDLPFEYSICSELGMVFPENLGPGDWALHICRELGADHYLNPVGGRELFDVDKYREAGVEIAFLDAALPSYDTPGYTPIPGLSILDALMWNAPSELRRAIVDGANIVTRSDE